MPGRANTPLRAAVCLAVLLTLSLIAFLLWSPRHHATDDVRGTNDALHGAQSLPFSFTESEKEAVARLCVNQAEHPLGEPLHRR